MQKLFEEARVASTGQMLMMDTLHVCSNCHAGKNHEEAWVAAKKAGGQTREEYERNPRK